MIVALDACALISLCRKKSAEDDKRRLEWLIKRTKAARGRIIIPTPAFAEFCVWSSTEEISLFDRRSPFLIAPFDHRAAIESSIIVRDVLNGGKKKPKDWQRVKTDIQIAAIAKICNATQIVTTDGRLTALSHRIALTPTLVKDLPLDEDDRQQPLFSADMPDHPAAGSW